MGRMFARSALLKATRSEAPYVVGMIVAAALQIAVALVATRDNISPITDAGEDWLRYHVYAASVVRDGAVMPDAPAPYLRPGGFGYVYFVALCYWAAGPEPRVVYAAQIALALLAALTYLNVLGAELGVRVRAGYALILFVFLGCDLWLNEWPRYQYRLLSENLLFPLLALAVWLCGRVHRRPSVWNALACGCACGACFLVRPNTALLGVAWAMQFGWQLRHMRKLALRCALGVIIGMLLIAALLVWRDHAAGSASTSALGVVRTTGDWLRPASVRDAPAFYAKRLAFVIGYHPALNETMSFRAHWMAAWIGASLYVVRSWARRRLSPFDSSLVVLVGLYYGPLFAVAQISSYGYRMMFPAMPVVFYLALRNLTPPNGRPESAG